MTTFSSDLLSLAIPCFALAPNRSMLAVASFPHGFETILTDAATLSQAHLIQPGRALGGRTPGKLLLSRVLTAISMTSCRTPVVQTDDVWLLEGGRLRLAKQTQDGIATPTDAKLTCRVCSCLASFSQPKPTEGFLQLFGALSVRMTERGESLDED